MSSTDSVKTTTDTFENQTSTSVNIKPDSAIAIDTSKDSLISIKLTRLVQDMYYWYETKNINGYGFDLIADDTIYISLENESLLERLREFKQSNYFSQTFIDNYEILAHALDQKLLNKEIEYYVGYYPPYGNGANPWCNCQDILENFWNYIEIENLNVSGDSASFHWTLKNQPHFEDFAYEMAAKEIDGEWRISYLQEFDYNLLFGER